MILDADELMWMRGHSLPEALATLPRGGADPAHPQRRGGRAWPGWRGVGHGAGGRARRSTRSNGADAPLFRPRLRGLVGHPEGEIHPHRAGLRDIRLKLHWAVTADGAPVAGPVWGAAEQAPSCCHLFSPPATTAGRQDGLARGGAWFFRPAEGRWPRSRALDRSGSGLPAAPTTGAAQADRPPRKRRFDAAGGLFARCPAAAPGLSPVARHSPFCR